MAVSLLSVCKTTGKLTWATSYDSYPYVCVLMLSETEGMVGGETYIQKGDGTAQKVTTRKTYAIWRREG